MKIFVLLAMTVFCPAVFCQSLVEPPYLHSYGIRKATPAKLFMFFGPITSFSDPQGIATAKMKSRDDPKTDKDDDEVVVYGVNAGRNQLIYNTSMWSLGLYGSKGSGKNQFMSPKGIAVDPEGNVYVADCGNNRIVHLFNAKKDVHWVNAFTGKTQFDRGLVSPSQVGLDKKGLIYVTDTGNRRIVIFSPDGAVCGIIPPAVGGTFSFDQGPSMLSVADGSDGWSFFSGDRMIFCTDKSGSRLWRINFDGTLEKQAPMPQGHAAGYAAVDYYHDLWVADRENHCILKFDRDLNLLDIFGSYGNGANQFIEPRGIAIWKRFGQTFIAERDGAQYYWIGTDMKAKSLQKSGAGYILSLALTEYSFVSLFSIAVKDTQWLFTRRLVSSGKSDLAFHDPGHASRLRPGCILRIEPTYSSYSYFKLDFPLLSKQE